jgi:hypothetical protein
MSVSLCGVVIVYNYLHVCVFIWFSSILQLLACLCSLRGALRFYDCLYVCAVIFYNCLHICIFMCLCNIFQLLTYLCFDVTL